MKMLILIYFALLTKELVVSSLIGGEPDKGLTSLNCSSKGCTADNSSLCVRSLNAPKDAYFQVSSCEAKKSLVCRNDVVYEIIGKKCSDDQKSKTITTKKPLKEFNDVYVPTIGIQRQKKIVEGKTKSIQVKSTLNFTRSIEDSKRNSRRKVQLKSDKTKRTTVKPPFNFTTYIESLKSKQKYLEMHQLDPLHKKNPYVDLQFYDELDSKGEKDFKSHIQKRLLHHQIQQSFTTISEYVPTFNYLSTKTRVNSKVKSSNMRVKSTTLSPEIRKKATVNLTEKTRGKLMGLQLRAQKNTKYGFFTKRKKNIGMQVKVKYLGRTKMLKTATTQNTSHHIIINTCDRHKIVINAGNQVVSIKKCDGYKDHKKDSAEDMIHIHEDSIKRPSTKHEEYMTKTTTHKTTTESDENQTYRPDTEAYPEDTTKKKKTKKQTKKTTYHSDDEEFSSVPPFTDGIITFPSDYETFTMPTLNSDESQTFTPDSEAYPEDTTKKKKTKKQTKKTTYHSDDEEFSSAPPFTDGILTLPSDYEHLTMPTFISPNTNNDVFTNPPLVDDPYTSQNYQNVEGFVPGYTTPQTHKVHFNDVVCDDSPCIQEVTEPFCVKIIESPDKFDELSPYVLIDQCDIKRAMFCNKNMKVEVVHKMQCLIKRGSYRRRQVQKNIKAGGGLKIKK